MNAGTPPDQKTVTRSDFIQQPIVLHFTAHRTISGHGSYELSVSAGRFGGHKEYIIELNPKSP
jgi:hypothetical protein